MPRERSSIDDVVANISKNTYYEITNSDKKIIKKEISQYRDELLGEVEREIDKIDMNLSQSPMRIIVLVKQKIAELKEEK